jgi:hypothetical protein
MKRILSALALVALTLVAANVWAAGQHSMAAAKSMTVKGEIVDMGCYLAHGARGADHASCAAKCISGGMPFGLLTSTGKLYLLTLNHDNPDPYNQCKDMAAKTVEVTGTLAQRSGFVAIDVSGVKAAQ